MAAYPLITFMLAIIVLKESFSLTKVGEQFNFFGLSFFPLALLNCTHIPASQLAIILRPSSGS
jgi:hypothetical protein